MPTPKRLYRYPPLGCAGPGTDDPDLIESRTFIENALYFTTRRKFDDPFDCLLPDMSKISDNQPREYMKARVLDEFTEKTLKQREAYAEELIGIGRSRIDQILQECVDQLGHFVVFPVSPTTT